MHGQNAASGAYIVYMDETLLVGHTAHIWTESYHWGILYMTEFYEKDILSMDTTLLVGHTVFTRTEPYWYSKAYCSWTEPF